MAGYNDNSGFYAVHAERAWRHLYIVAGFTDFYNF